MPTIEIVCLEQEKPQDFPSLSLALFSENQILSHRGLFFDELKVLNGCIYHFGNPEMRGPDYEGLWAGRLLDWGAGGDGILQFVPEYVGEIQMILARLMDDSPIHKLIFLSDYQFGPSQVRRYKRPLTLENFWQKHEEGKLWINASYLLEN